MPRLSRQDSRDQTRHRLRTAAISEFARRGVGGASVDRITEAAGFSRGAFYSNYASKRDLLLDLVLESQAAEVETWTALIEQAADLESLFLELKARFDAFAERGDWGLLSVELLLEAERDPEFGRLYREQTTGLLNLVIELVRRLHFKAGRKEAPNAEVVAVALRAFTVGLTLHRSHGAELQGHSPGTMVVLFLRAMLDAPTINKDAKSGIGP